MKAGMIFPGQGSQFPGMGRDLAETFPAAADLYREADETLGEPISRICFQGDPEVLTQTRNAQPAILLHSMAVLRVLGRELDAKPAIVAGHSLGEYSALVAAGVLSEMDALRIVRRRGELMYEAGRRQPGTMAALIGMSREEVEALCADIAADGATVVVANVNAPGQIVISGEMEAIDRAVSAARERGAKKSVRLNVSGAFHSPLVAPAERELVAYMREFRFTSATVDVVCNVDAKPIRDAGEIAGALSRQLTSPVLWSDSMTELAKRWDGRILEVGPGKVLAGLMKRIESGRAVENCGTAEELARLIAAEVELT